MAYETINPYSGERGKHYAEHTPAEVEAAVAQAQTCFATWQTTTFAARREQEIDLRGSYQRPCIGSF